MSKQLAVVKIGSSVLAEPDGGVRRSALVQICDEVAAVWSSGWRIVLVTSGAVARGREVMQRGSSQVRLEVLQALSAIGQGKLFREFDEQLAQRDIKSAQILLTFLEASERENRKAATLTLQRLLEWDVVPIINENDTVTTDALTFGDNDYLAAQIATMLDAERMLLLTDADGVFTSDPRVNKSAELLHRIDDPDDAIARYSIGDSTSPLGSGGMKSKLRAAQLAALGGVATVICNGNSPGVIARVLRGDPLGTIVDKHKVRESWSQSRKFWLEHGKPTRGRVIIDLGAVRALTERGASLLPVGIHGVDGAFGPGDAVEIVNVEGVLIGKGLSNFSAAEIARVRGLQTREVQALMPDAPDEAIGRDSLIVLTKTNGATASGAN
jgi:glutamate 5-kinase